MPTLKSGDIPNWVLFKFYLLAMHGSSDGVVTRGQWNAVRPFLVSNLLIARACDELLAKGYLEEDVSFEGAKEFSISREGLNHIEARFEGFMNLIDEYVVDERDEADDDVLIDKVNERLRPAVDFRGGAYLDVAATSVPASDRVVSLDHNSAAYKDATAKLDAVINEIDRANDLGDMTEVEKEQTRAVLSAARRLLNETKIRVSTLHSALLPTLNWLKANFGNLAIGIASAVAAGAILKLFGLA